ncbi:hypothetical protein FSP39_017255 [Pinctada imbricata]|uniref:PDZ domain-containing protein n=1 Tax=Pinctada imbricata TaxID=66713 RepID=A0AA88Y9T6_PINIB|nr:hypothetical protein FSP39_017255 [Pinctada imbricata]
MYHHQHSHSVGTASQPKRRKKRPIHGVKTVEVTRGKSGYGFTISGQNPCVLSVIVPGSPADVAGLKSGDYLVAVGNRNVTKEPHDDVVRMVGMSTGTLVLQVAENYNSSDSSDDEYQHRHKARYPNRVRSRHATTGSKTNDKVLREHNHRERHKTEYKHKDPYVSKQDPHLRSSQSKGRIPKPTGSENNYTSSNSSHDSTPQFAGPLPIEKRSMISHSNLQATPLLHHPQSKQAVVKTFSQSAQPLRYGAEGRNSEKQSRSNISPSLHGSFLAPGISSYLKTSAQQNQSNFADNAFLIVDDEEGDDEESLLNYSFHDMRVVVGYIGSIEMPSDAHKPHIRVQSIRSAVRRLRVEQKIHTLVLMEVSQDGVKLTNTMGTTIAHYPASIISFSGVCPDDKRFFGIVTLHSSTSDPESENEENSQAESEASPSGSCHVFMVDPEMKSHNIHAQKAKDFGITCTPNVDRHLCAEFPKSATPVIMSITNLYKDRPGGAGENGVAFSQAFADPSRAPQRSDSNSSNSDSGLGFGVREAPAVPRGPGAVGGVQPRTVQLPRENWSGESVELDQGPVQHLAQPQCSPGVQTMPTPHKLSVQSINTARGTSLTNGHCEFASPPVPVFPERLVHSHETTAKVVKLNENKSHFNSEQNLRANGKIRNSKSMSRTTSHPDLKRPTSAPFNQFSENSAFVNYQHDKNKVETVDMDDRLSPRAMLPPPFHQLRSPSAPPSVGQRIEDSDSDSNDFDFPANTSGMGSLIQRFEQDHALRISSPANVSRRFSEGFAISQQVCFSQLLHYDKNEDYASEFVV